MDFSFSEEQLAVIEAAEKLFSGHLTDERRAEVEAAGEGFDRGLWAALADANLLGIAISEADGGSGYGFAELAVLLEQAGHAAAPVPLWPALVLGGLPVAQFGGEALRKELLGPLCSGDRVITAALVEAGAGPLQPATTARQEGAGWTLHGSKTCVPAGLVASHFLVPATTGEGEVTVFVVDAGVTGLKLTRLETTTGIPEARIDLEGVTVDDAAILGHRGDGREILEWLLPRATAGLCSLMAGTCKAAVELTAAYAVGRQQFGRLIATFQAVGQRAADAYIDAEAVQLTARQAAWRLSEGREADEQVAIAKFWAADGGQRVVHAAQHIHGGVGVDRSYPLHRYFLAAKQLELTLGGATASLVSLGSMMAARPA